MERNEVFSTSFSKSVLNICLIKAQKSNLSMPCNKGGTIHQKTVLFLWEGVTLHWVVVGYKFNIISDMN